MAAHAWILQLWNWDGMSGTRRVGNSLNNDTNCALLLQINFDRQHTGVATTENNRELWDQRGPRLNAPASRFVFALTMIARGVPEGAGSEANGWCIEKCILIWNTLENEL